MRFLLKDNYHGKQGLEKPNGYKKQCVDSDDVLVVQAFHFVVVPLLSIQMSLEEKPW